jgi:predicted XRE-type DNA-binding protein
MAKSNPHIGTSLDSLLADTGQLVEANEVAVKRLIAWQISNKMKKENISKTRMAKLMVTSRSALDRLLDPGNTSVTLRTMDNAARALGKTLRIELVDC